MKVLHSFNHVILGTHHVDSRSDHKAMMRQRMPGHVHVVCSVFAGTSERMC